MKFAEWFDAQHGARPSPIDISRLRDSIESQRYVLARDEALLRSLEKWDACNTTALFAWQIREDQKG
jgi:hypothetical protein